MTEVLDHGYVRLLNVAGPTRRQEARFDAHDVDPANVARKSFGQKDSGRTEAQDLKLANYLMDNRHLGPFEMVQTWWEMKLPIFVARQLIRHRTASVNEISARYTKLPADWYIPAFEQVTTKAVSNKQGRSAEPYPEAEEFRSVLNGLCAASYAHYEYYLSRGVAPELCRMLLHMNHYTEWVWRMDLRNLFHVFDLRCDPHAQWETRQYADAMKTLIRNELPHLLELYDQTQRPCHLPTPGPRHLPTQTQDL